MILLDLIGITRILIKAQGLSSLCFYTATFSYQIKTTVLSIIVASIKVNISHSHSHSFSQGSPKPSFQTYIDKNSGDCDKYGQELSYLEDTLLTLRGKKHEYIVHIYIEVSSLGNVTAEDKYFTDVCEKEDDIVDDHSPYLEEGLRRVLHVISDPFPDTWHTMEDNIENLDMEAIIRVNRLIRLFVAEFLNLEMET